MMPGHICFALAFVIIAAAGASTDEALVKVDRVEIRESTGELNSSYWVFFRDKGIVGPEAMRAALSELERLYPARAVARRKLRRTAPGLFDERDLPVSQAYVAQVRATGAQVRVTTRWVNAVSVDATDGQRRAIEGLSCVERVQPLAHTAPFEMRDVREVPRDGGESTADFYGYASEQLHQIGIPSAHSAGYTGEGMIIGVLDTGFHRSHEAYTHSGHAIAVLGEYDWVRGDGNTQKEQGDDPWQHWHGTAILGEIAAYKPNVYVGGAYDAAFYLAKTEDVTREVPLEEDFYVAALEWFEQNGVDVATSSLGYIDWYTQEDLDGRTAVTTIGVNVATENGVACCTAAGNAGHDRDPRTSHLIAPADAFDVFTCGAVNVYGETGGFSSDGPTADGRVKPEAMACGDVAYLINPDDDRGYTTGSGTSCSTPLVASAVTLLVQAHPDWTVAQLRSALLRSGSIYRATGSYDPYYIEGFGIIDVWRAIETDFTGDLDRDGDTDLADHAALAACLAGPGVEVGGECARTDLDLDDDADLHDWAGLQNAYWGEW
ncbi:MAG: peptidase S8 [Planctomycetota bacterium]|nr:MAG: peptidase S8 [Planctomycetota bacterium]